MRITRRKFLMGSALGMGAAVFPALLPHDAFAARKATKPATKPLDYEQAFAQLSRLSFGATIGECDILIHQGLAAYLETQLHPDEASDPEGSARLAAATLHIEYKANDRPVVEAKDGKPAVPAVSYPAMNEDRPLSLLDKPIEALWPLTDNSTFIDGRERNRPLQEVRAATWVRAVYSKWQLREVMVEFWHNHFNVTTANQPQIATTFPLYDKLMRRHCFGNFRAMLEDVAQSPAMLYYLNNGKSRASPANENYARELFELHTLGADHYYNGLYNRWREVPGAVAGHPIGYIDQDVYEAARAFTGWTIEDGTNTGRGTIFPKTGKFVYFDGWHDNYQKRVLGTEFDPNAPPMADGRKVLDLIAAHPGTAIFLSTKLCQRFIGDNPPAELIQRVAKIWQQTVQQPDQVAQVLRAIILSPEFAACKEEKVKRPFDFVVSFIRATGGNVAPNDSLLGMLNGTGYRQFEWPTPTGHPDNAAYWLNSNTTLSCWNLLPNLLSPNFKATNIDLVQQTPDSVKRSDMLIAYWYERMTGRMPNAPMVASLMQFMPHPENPAFEVDIHQANFKQPLQEMVMTIAMLPDFSVRG